MPEGVNVDPPALSLNADLDLADQHEGRSLQRVAPQHQQVGACLQPSQIDSFGAQVEAGRRLQRATGADRGLDAGQVDPVHRATPLAHQKQRQQIDPIEGELQAAQVAVADRRSGRLARRRADHGCQFERSATVESHGIGRVGILTLHLLVERDRLRQLAVCMRDLAAEVDRIVPERTGPGPVSAELDHRLAQAAGRAVCQLVLTGGEGVVGQRVEHLVPAGGFWVAPQVALRLGHGSGVGANALG